MFKFNFEVEEEGGLDATTAEVFGGLDPTVPQDASHADEFEVEVPAREISLETLMSELPNVISFSPLSITVASNHDVVLARRDLFDARFQIISAEDSEASTTGRSDIDFLDAPSDLVPGVYEGGLKTWECSLDLVYCMDSIHGDEIGMKLKGRRILELGCGTAVPSLYLLNRIFSSGPSSSDLEAVHVHLQDYNEMVLRLVTLPNVILAWYMSPASSTYRDTASKTSPNSSNQNELVLGPIPDLPPASPTEPGEIALTPELKSAFLNSLQTYSVNLKFFAGGWDSFDVAHSGGPYDVVLTSETIYRPASLPALIRLLRHATKVPPTNQSMERLEDATVRLALAEKKKFEQLATSPYLCLVAAKLVYFGVGGGVNEFVRAVEEGPEHRGKVETVWETSRGVRRNVMRVIWDA